jgi:hypothetical protein
MVKMDWLDGDWPELAVKLGISLGRISMRTRVQKYIILSIFLRKVEIVRELFKKNILSCLISTHND